MLGFNVQAILTWTAWTMWIFLSGTILNGCFATKNGVLDPEFDSIQIAPSIRNYITGPIDGHMLITKHDSITLYAGPLPPDLTSLQQTIRRWVVWGDADTADSLCFIQRVYDYGRKVVFQCPIIGTLVAYVEDRQMDRFILQMSFGNMVGTVDKPEALCASRRCLQYFDITDRYKSQSSQSQISDEEFYKNFIEKRATIVNLPQSDPIGIVNSDFCYYWNYRMEQKARVGFVFRESEPRTGVSVEGSYIIMEVEIWIIEPNSVTESEINPSLEKLTISDYSKLLTKKFRARGLLPCLRKVHPAVELSSDIVFVDEGDSDLNSPHWKLELKIHTDTLVSSISDVTFTISSRQHVALFHCFVGDIRVFVNIRDFDFIDEAQSDRNQVNWEISQIGKPREEFLKLKIKHVYGHGTAHVGQAVSRVYQPGDSRTDMLVINNPCVAQEFAFAVGGRIYIAENFLKDYLSDVVDIVVPGLTHLDAEDKKTDPVKIVRRHLAFLNVADVAFTPTHIAILMEDSSIYIHSHSIYYKGLAYLTEAKKFRVGAFVKRRWCARSGTPKTHNMMLPGYSPRGDIIVIQVYPTEGSTNLWVDEAPSMCVTKNGISFQKSRAQIIQDNVNETCIHRDELVIISDERGLEVSPNQFKEECQEKFGDLQSEKSTDNPDELQSYLMNHGVLFPENDPHFPKELTDLSIHKIGDNYTFFNLAFIFEVDRNGDKLKQALTSHGFDLTPEPIKLHSVEFTAVEKMFITGVVFEAKEFERSAGGSYSFTMLITSVTAVDQPVDLHPEGLKEQEPFKTVIPFPGVLVVRAMPYMVKTSSGKAEYITKIYPMNTALPSYVVDLGNVYIFSSVESKYARPLSYFPRKKIHDIVRNIKRGDVDSNNILLKEDRTAVFIPKDYNCPSKIECPNPSNQLFDIVVTEQGVVSVLRRRVSNSSNSKSEEGQTLFIGSVTTLDSLREVQPFSSDDNVFQFATTDGEIVYGKFTVRGIGFFPNCSDSEELKEGKGKSCFVQLRNPLKGALPFCTSYHSVAVPCREWTFVNRNNTAETAPDYNLIGYCNDKDVDANGCVHKGADELMPPENYPKRELDSAEILGVSFHSLLNGNLELVTEEKITDSKVEISGGGISKNKQDRICPFVNFDVKYLKFDYAEIGFSTRIFATISYLGKNVPAEAVLIIEYESVPGVVVEISEGQSKEKDETTLTKTIDITMTLPDIALRRMLTDVIRTDFRDKTNLAREIVDAFSITIRPSIINLRCKKEDSYTTIQFNIGCSPFNKMSLLAPASPLIKRSIKRETEKFVATDWRREGDFLSVPKDHVWHRQRERFDCDADNEPRCKIPFAYLYNDEVYELSWRDPFVPQFEQILAERVRRVTGNVAVYDLLGFNTIMNVTQLDALCYNNGSTRAEENSELEPWYKRILDSTQSLGKKASERENIYNYFSDCYDSSVLPRASSLELSLSFYRLINRTNFNQIRFDVVKPMLPNFPNITKNRNQILIFRATVVNTNFNRFTYCQLMDMFFLIRLTGSPPPRQGLQRLDAALVLALLLLLFVIIYFIFYKFCTWKLDIPAIPGADQEEPEPEGQIWKTQFGPVESDHMMKRLAVKVHAVAKWRQKALQRVIKRYQDDPNQKPKWAKARLHEEVSQTTPEHTEVPEGMPVPEKDTKQ